MKARILFLALCSIGAHAEQIRLHSLDSGSTQLEASGFRLQGFIGTAVPSGESGANGFSTAGGFWWIRVGHSEAGELLADMNCDGAVTVSDIGGFVLALTNPAGYAAQYPECDINSADMNQDGVVSVGDIGLFVEVLTGG